VITIPNHQVLSKIYESANTLVYRGRRNVDGLPVIFKILKEDFPTPEELTRYKQEYELTRNLNLKGVIRAEALEKYQNTLVIISEDFGGESLKVLLSQQALNLQNFISVAIKICESLSDVHTVNIIHKDINPSNIVFNPKTGQLKIIDFGISTVLSRENPTIKNPEVLEGTLAYISPEQTGRMNRSLDYRTDFYSLGVTFYELLTHRPPFEGTDAMELVHCHIAKQPVPPHELNLEIPKVVSNIIMKLLAKTAEDRYQSAWGIKADLEECLYCLQNDNQIDDFPLGCHDISDKFQIPQKLYGREREVEKLITAFESMISDEKKSRIENRQIKLGKSQLMLVSGYSGIGKSVLVQEVYKPITQRRGYFISGKFDQFQRNIPYSAIVRAFQSLVRQLLTESKDKLDQWKYKLQQAFGCNGQIIIDVIPEVELIVGSQPPVQELGLAESQNRFNLVFKNFIKVFCQQEHPLVIFLDDLQWTDSATLKLLELMITDDETQYLFIIGAYRDNEVNPNHPLITTIESLRKENAIINEIILNPLSLDHIINLIADTFHSQAEVVKPLADLVKRKTQGNPFFVNQFLRTLYQENLVTFNFEQFFWEGDIAQIEAVDITDNVVELMIGKLQKLPTSTQQVLRLAACVGNRFDLNTLSIIYEQPIITTFQDLFPVVQDGFILPTSELESIDSEAIKSQLVIINYKFLHDRVQQAAYALIDERQKKAVHLNIGQLLLRNRSFEEQNERLFEIVDHLNLGRTLIVDVQEKVKLATLNLEAGKKAKEATAYASAKVYLTIGMESLTTKSWDDYYDLTFALHKERAEVEYLNGNLEKSEELINVIRSRAKSVLEKAEVCNLLIVQYTLKAKYQEAIHWGREALYILGIDLPEENFHIVFEEEIAKLKENLKNQDIASLVNKEEMVLQDKKIAVKLLANLGSTAYRSNQKLWEVIVVKSINLFLKYGNIPESCYGYSNYGTLLGSVLKDYKSGYESALVSVKLSEKYNDLAQKSRACFILSNFVHSWVKPIKQSYAINNEGYQAALESGEFQFAGYTLSYRLSNLFSQGKNLEELFIDTSNFLVFSQKTKNQWAIDANLGFQLMMLNLTARTTGKLSFDSEDAHEEQYLKGCKERGSFSGLCRYYILKCQALYLYGETAEALSLALMASKLLAYILGVISVAEHNFYYSLILTALYPDASAKDKKQYWKELEINQKQMQIWADNCPENFLHKYLLVAAEMNRVCGNDLESMDLYDQAIASARENTFVQNEALSNELAGKFWLSKGKEEFAKLYITKAHYCYQLWGAKRKVEDLEDQYPHLLHEILIVAKSRSPGIKPTKTTTGRGSGAELDLATVIKASQTISGEILLDKLLTKLMKILIENAGAQRGLLILESKGKLLIEAEGSITNDKLTVLQSIPVDRVANLSKSPLPLAVINYVFRTKESVVLNDALVEGGFTNDPYILENNSKSILCSPLLNQGKLISIIYLENNLSIGAFTPNRLEVLKLLSSQAAISIENAKLYSELQMSESRLAQFLEAIPVGVGVLDATGKPYYVNRTAQELLGQGVVLQATSQEIAEVYKIYVAGTQQEYPNSHLPLVRALSGESATADDMEIHQGDKIIPIESRGTPIFDEKGNIAYAITAFQDITERKKAEAERLKFTTELFQLNQAYERFVPREFLQFLDKESILDVKLGDQVQREMSVLFADIRSFTTLSESMTPEDNFKFINSYLSRMEPIIGSYQGFIDKYIGDAIMALFSGEADNAVKAAIAMLHQLADYNQHRIQASYAPIQIGIGINTGSLMLGTVGGHNRMDGTVISDAVNLASRIESLTKDYAVSLLITHQTFSRLVHPAEYAIRKIDEVKVKGKSECVTVYEVFDADAPKVRESKIATATVFEEALALYNLDSFSEAAQRFEDCLQQNPADRVAQIYLNRCQGG
jgi:PAS domain S-box-containing protein